MDNFIKVPKTIVLEPWYKEKHGRTKKSKLKETIQPGTTKRVFVMLLLCWNHSAETVHGQSINENQIVITVAEISDRLGITTQNTRTALKNLTETGYISTQRKNTGNIITFTDKTVKCEKGFAPFPRTVAETIWDNGTINEFILYLHCYIKFNHPETEYNGRSVLPGEYLTDYTELAKETGLTTRQVGYMLKTENRANFIICQSQVTNEKRPKSLLLSGFSENDFENLSIKSNKPFVTFSQVTNKVTNKVTNENEPKSQAQSGFSENDSENLSIYFVNQFVNQSNKNINKNISNDSLSINQSISKEQEPTEKPVDNDLIDNEIKKFFVDYHLTNITPEQFTDAFYHGGKWVDHNGKDIANWQGFARYINKNPEQIKPKSTNRTITTEPRAVQEPKQPKTSYNLEQAETEGTISDLTFYGFDNRTGKHEPIKTVDGKFYFLDGEPFNGKPLRPIQYKKLYG